MTLHKTEGYTAIPLRFNRSRHLVVTGRVAGRKLDWIVDTGAGTTVIDLETAKRMALAMDLSESKAGGLGASGMEVFRLPPIRIVFHGFEAETSRAMVLDLSHVNTSLAIKKARQVQGVIGADILRAYSAVIDYGEKLLFLKG